MVSICIVFGWTGQNEKKSHEIYQWTRKIQLPVIIVWVVHVFLSSIVLETLITLENDKNSIFIQIPATWPCRYGQPQPQE